MPLLHVIIMLTVLALLAIFVAGVHWIGVLVTYAVLLLIMIVLYKR